MSVEETLRVEFDDYPFAEVATLYERHYSGLFHPEEGYSWRATERLQEVIEYWQQEERSTVVFTSGVYDLMHLDHKGYLLHTKLAGAPVHYANQGNQVPWNELAPERQRHLAERYIESGQLRLVVSVDGDKSVASRKQGKGGARRPITGWPTRARSVAEVTFQTIGSYDSPKLIYVADAVTVHGPNDFDETSPHNNLIDLVSLLQPDVWTVFEESQDILDTAPIAPALGSVALRCIPMGDGSRYFTDPIIDKFSTTNILKRAHGEL